MADERTSGAAEFMKRYGNSRIRGIAGRVVDEKWVPLRENDKLILVSDD